MREAGLKVVEKIEEYDSIVIFRHRSPDLDAVGSQMALKELIAANYPYKNVYAFGDEKKYDFDFVAPFDKVSDLVISRSLVIVVDTANAERVSSQSYLSAKEIIKIDHHQDLVNERYGKDNYVYPEKSSTCEVLYYLFNDIPTIRFNAEVARRLFIGMYADTGGFSFPNTKSETFLALSELVKYDFNYEETVSNLKVFDLKVIQAVGFAYLNVEIKNNVGYIFFDKKWQDENDIKAHQISQVANFLGSIKELEAWVVFNQYKGFVRANIRSRQKYDISKVAARYNGGGHKNASGAMVYSDMERFDLVNELIEEVLSVH